MPICRDRMAATSDLDRLHNEYPVVQVRLRVRWNDMSRFLGIYSEHFTPVDRATREVLMFLHEYRVHFNLTFLYRYRSWEDWANFTDRYSEAWALVHRTKDFADARRQIEEQEAAMNSMIEDEERLLFIEFRGTNWGPRADSAV